MNRMLGCGLLAAIVTGLVAAGSVGGPRQPAAQPRPATPALPDWLAPPPVPAPGPTVYRTQYLSASGVKVAGAVVAQPDARPLVWVVDGAGDLHGCSNALSQANMMLGNPAELAPFAWSHGYRRLLLDQIDMAHAKTQGARLAEKILERQRAEPGRRVVVVAHSAGCAVALEAGDALPADAIDRMILLAPSVSTGFDVRPSLRSAREGIDVFCSKKDWVALGFVTRVVGTTDKFWAPAAGRHGFDLRQQQTAEDQLAARLRQHFWSPEVAWTGHTGGHHGMHTQAFLHTYVFPLMGVRAQ